MEPNTKNLETIANPLGRAQLILSRLQRAASEKSDMAVVYDGISEDINILMNEIALWPESDGTHRTMATLIQAIHDAFLVACEQIVSLQGKSKHVEVPTTDEPSQVVPSEPA